MTYIIAEKGKGMPHLASLENYSFRRNTPGHVARELFETAAGKTAKSDGNGKKQKCTTQCEPAGCPPPRCICCTHNSRGRDGGSDWNARERNDIDGGGGHCELWINCHRVFDLWRLCRFRRIERAALFPSILLPTFSGWCDVFLFLFFFQGDSSLFGSRSLFLAPPVICFRLIDCARLQNERHFHHYFSLFFLWQRISFLLMFLSLLFSLFIFLSLLSLLVPLS